MPTHDEVIAAFREDRDDQYVLLLEYANTASLEERREIASDVWEVANEYFDDESPTWIVWDSDDERIAEALEDARQSLAWLRKRRGSTSAKGAESR